MWRGMGVVLGLAITGVAMADESLRCNLRLVGTGDSMARVLSLCGEPYYRSQVAWRSRVSYHPYIESVESVPVEEWVYDLGTTSFLRTVTFEAGHVVDIESGDKP